MHSSPTNTDHVINRGRDHAHATAAGRGSRGRAASCRPFPDGARERGSSCARPRARLDDPTLGFTIGEFVEVTSGPNQGERGLVRLCATAWSSCACTPTASAWTSSSTRPSCARSRWRPWKRRCGPRDPQGAHDLRGAGGGGCWRPRQRRRERQERLEQREQQQGGGEVVWRRPLRRRRLGGRPKEASSSESSAYRRRKSASSSARRRRRRRSRGLRGGANGGANGANGGASSATKTTTRSSTS